MLASAVVLVGRYSGTCWLVQWYMLAGAVVHVGWCSGTCWLVQWYMLAGAVVHVGWCSGTCWLVQWYMLAGAVIHVCITLKSYISCSLGHPIVLIISNLQIMNTLVLRLLLFGASHCSTANLVCDNWGVLG